MTSPNITEIKIEEDTDSTKKNKKRIIGKIEQISVNQKYKTKKYKSKIIKKKLHFIDYLFIIIKNLKKLPNFISEILGLSKKYLFYGMLGTMLSFIFAIKLFPEIPGIFAVFFCTLFISPFILKETRYAATLSGRTHTQETKGVKLTSFSVKENRFSIKDFYEENRRTLSIYLYFFIGIMIVIIFLIAIIPPELSQSLFSFQGWENNLIPSKNIGFEGLNKGVIFKEILLNNLSVLFVCFIVALFFPIGATLMIVWNAMYWAVSFSQYALYYSSYYNISFLTIFIPLILSISLHTIIEAICYFFASISGNTLSIGISKEPFGSDRFVYIIKYSSRILLFSVIFLLLGSFIETFVFDILKNIFFSFI
jgi:hypothetical protein